MDSPKPCFYEFDDYRLNSTDKILLKGDEIISLTPKQFDTLQILVENSGQTIPKHIFLDKVWGDTFVEESNLSQNIFRLRKILGKPKEGASFIETIPKRGFRFTIPVNPITGRNRELKTESKTGASAKKLIGLLSDLENFGKRKRILAGCFIFLGLFVVLFYGFQKTGLDFNNSTAYSVPTQSLAVVFFEDVENNGGNLLQPAFTDDLINRLGNIESIRVRPFISILKADQTSIYQIARDLEVSTILFGNISVKENRIQINARLINLSDEKVLWSKSLESSPEKFFQAQITIATEVAQTLVGEVKEKDDLRIRKNLTDNFEAFQIYGRGQYLLKTNTESNINKSIEYFRDAISKDQKFGRAYQSLSEAYAILASGNLGKANSLDYQKLTKENALKAIEVDNSLGYPHAIWGAVSFDENRDWGLAEKMFTKAIALEPNNPLNRRIYSLHLLYQGQFVKAQTEILRALESDPKSLILNSRLGLIYYFGGNYEKASKQFEKTLEIDPHFLSAKVDLALTLAELNETDRAISILEQIHDVYPDNTRVSTTLGYLFARKGNTTAASQVLENLEKLAMPSVSEQYGMAIINLQVGKTEKAMAIIEKISEAKDLYLATMIKFDPKLDQLRNNETMVKITMRLG